MLEVIALGIGLLVPLLYGVVSVMSVQAATYAATSAAREAARTYVTATTPAQGARRARAATRLVLADAGLTAVAPAVRCRGGCLVPGSRVDVAVVVDVPAAAAAGRAHDHRDGAGVDAGRPLSVGAMNASDRRMRAWIRRRDERGSVLPLIIGAVVVMTMLVTVVTDVSVLWLARRSLQSAVDGAALAGAQAVDLPTVYADGATGDLALDPRAARTAVRDYVRALPAAQLPAGAHLVTVTATTTTVSVRGQATVRLPFLSFLTGRGVPVVAEASARNAAG